MKKEQSTHTRFHMRCSAFVARLLKACAKHRGISASAHAIDVLVKDARERLPRKKFDECNKD